MQRGTMISVTAAGLVSLAATALMTSRAGAQTTPFVALGAGMTIPSSRSSDAMRNGWMTEAMAGVTVLDGIIGLRAGASYGESTVDPTSGGMGSVGGMSLLIEGGRAKRLAVMLGAMFMPIEIGRFAPYALADAGTVRSSFIGHTNAFTWQLGGGVMVDLPRTRLYVESRYMQARKGSDSGAMVPVTVGLRFPR